MFLIFFLFFFSRYFFSLSWLDGSDDIDADAEAEEVLNELNLLSENSDGENRKNKENQGWNQVGEFVASIFY